MLPTPSTSHVSFDRIYEPAEDSFLLLDTISSASETSFLKERFSTSQTQLGSPVVLEVGTGSGVVLAFAAENSQALFGRPDVLVLGTDINSHACHASAQTVQNAVSVPGVSTISLHTVNTDLVSSLRPHSVDVLLFNPPYVPTEGLPDATQHETFNDRGRNVANTFEGDSHLLALSYAGGLDGMETTNRLLAELDDILHRERGVAYILLCAQNKPEEIKNKILRWGQNWRVVIAGHSGNKAGWEKLQILRIWRESPPK